MADVTLESLARRVEALERLLGLMPSPASQSAWRGFIEQLSPERRIALALEIWESLGGARPPARLTAEQRAELARRDAELDANPGIALTWEQIRASVETKP
jgi:putative addiction module component (TIGR02574 family)